MRKFWLFLGLFPVLALPARAQDVPRLEVFAGYAYGSINAGPEISNNQRHSLNGWDAQVAANANRWFGVAFDYTGYTGQPTVAGGPVNTRIHILTAGPRVSWRKSGRFVAFVHALLGMEKATGFVGGDFATHTNFAAQVGGGANVKVSKHFAIRLVEADWIHSRIAQNKFDSNFAIIGTIGQHQNSAKVATGIVFTWGGGS